MRGATCHIDPVSSISACNPRTCAGRRLTLCSQNHVLELVDVALGVVDVSRDEFEALQERVQMLKNTLWFNEQCVLRARSWRSVSNIEQI